MKPCKVNCWKKPETWRPNHWVRPRGRCCSGTCRFSQRGKICQHGKRIPLCAHRGRNFGPDEHIGMSTVCQSGKKDLLGVRRWQGRSYSVPESFGAGAALQRCIVTWHLASHRLHGLMTCTHLCIILIFKLPREHIYQWWANHKSNHKYKSQIICKNDLNQNLKSKIKSKIIK